MKLEGKKLEKTEGNITLLTEFAKVHIEGMPKSYFTLFHKENNCSLNNSDSYKYTEFNYFYDENDKTERGIPDPKPAVFKLVNTEHQDFYRLVGKAHGLIMHHGVGDSSFRITKSPIENCFRIAKESGEVLCLNKANEPLFMNPN